MLRLVLIHMEVSVDTPKFKLIRLLCISPLLLIGSLLAFSMLTMCWQIVSGEGIVKGYGSHDPRLFALVFANLLYILHGLWALKCIYWRGASPALPRGGFSLAERLWTVFLSLLSLFGLMILVLLGSFALEIFSHFSYRGMEWNKASLLFFIFVNVAAVGFGMWRSARWVWRKFRSRKATPSVTPRFE